MLTLPGAPTQLEDMLRTLGYLQHLRDEVRDFSLNGWTSASLQRRVEEWHEENQRNAERVLSRATKKEAWKKIPVQPFTKRMDNGKYKIVELCTSEELEAESRVMSHCVRTYANRCARGRCSIWSLRFVRGGKTTSLVTVEVNPNRMIVQAKARFNARPDEDDMELIREWAQREKLKMHHLVDRVF